MKNLKSIRKEKKITSQQIADALQISSSSISQYETGKREPSYERLIQIADYLNVTTDQLLGRKEKPKETSSLNTNSSNFALNLKELRNKHAWTQEELANKIGLSRSSIAMYESSGSLPDLNTLSLIASIFNVTTDHLLEQPNKRALQNENFVNFLKEKINDKSLNQIEMQTGITKSYLSKVLRGERSTPKPETLKKLAPSLPCSYEDLMREAGYINVGKFECEIVDKLASLIIASEKTISEISQKSGVSRTMIYKILNKEVSALSSNTITLICDAINQPVSILFQLEKNLNQNFSSFIGLPIFSEIPAGIPIEMIDASYIEDYEDVSTELLKGNKKAFCLKVKGESMMPKFEDGDILVLIQQEDCNSGDYCAVSINHTECTFKKIIKHSNGITLQPLNPSFEPMFFTKQQIEELPITILGVVKEVRRSI